MKKLSILLFAVPSLYFAQLATPQGQLQTTTNPETGNIGIGTTTPDQKLVVNFNNEPKTIKFYQPVLNSNPAYSLASSLMFTWYNENADIGMIRGGDKDILGLGFRINGQEKMRLNYNGNVGIGTTTPQAKLNIYGAHGDTNLLLHSIGNGADAPAYLNLWASEPGLTFSGVGIGNNIKHWDIASQTPFSRFNNARGASYIRLLENQIVFTTVDATGKFVQALNIGSEGNVAVTNKLEAKEIKVTTTPTADFVFEDSYQLPDLASVEKHIKEKKHLPEIASAAEMQKNGVNIGDFQIKLLQKIEELTLYSIEQNKQNKELFRTVEKQQEQIKNLEKNIQQPTNTK
ncbi:hypothetical protein OZ664_12115 [Elizabethkingia sp. HX WHF]|uniref:hypothetical protein n=1 Tax=Elizabethkingia TaxID=308865 RepID=UPI00099966B7|nr:MULTISPECIES: hypothetical protein [Elizabethkingia]MCL1638304.1 DUF3450 domain-containing protein [Elizabethkingia bruuniana]MDX8564747.1 hypothetical protein [Elizabethkingia sp. HX WHF]OPC26438.1 hypothetical protein BAY00_03850 [Elizabethkingia bruuniana]